MTQRDKIANSETYAHRQRDNPYRQIVEQTDRETDKHTDTETDKQTDTETDKQTDTETDKQTENQQRGERRE